MDSFQSLQAAVWALLGSMCLLSIVWGVTRGRGRRPPGPFFAAQAAFAFVCLALAGQAMSVAVLPMRMPVYVQGLLDTSSADGLKPAALSPKALEEFENARGQVRASVHHVATTVMPGSRSLFVEVTFGNSDILLLNVAYRGDLPAWMPVTFGPYRLFIESAVFLPYQRSPRQMIAAHPRVESPA